jgi:UPF0716 protein FxsA
LAVVTSIWTEMPLRNSTMPRFSFLPLILLALPLAEIAVFVMVGSRIGILPMIALVVLTALLGTAILRRQGLGIAGIMQREMQAGRMPARELADGAMLMAAGVLLLLPGFITDTLGLLLFIPALRRWIFRVLSSRVVVATVRPSRDSGHGDVIDLGDDEYSNASDVDHPVSDDGDLRPQRRIPPE